MSFDISQFLNGLARGEQRQLDAAREAAGEFAEHVMSESQELVPVSPTNPKHPLYIGTSGALQDSATVKDAEVTAEKVEVAIGYNTDYAAAVHERLDANHQYPGRVKEKAQAKYLSEPMETNAPKFGPFVAERMKGATGG